MSADNNKPDAATGKRVILALDPKTNKKVKVELQGRNPPSTGLAQAINLETGQAVTVMLESSGRNPPSATIQN